MPTTYHTLAWRGGVDGYLELLDQTRLPTETVYLECRTAEDVWQAIRQLSVRGAPAIGVAAAYGVCVGIQGGRSVDEVCDYLATSRPDGGEPLLGARTNANSEPGRPRPGVRMSAFSPRPAPSTTKTARCAPRSADTARICSPICRPARAFLRTATQER